jgi:diguanylate cyclase (GGDEF)-like protein
LLIPLEMLAVNLFVVNSCSKPKYGRKYTKGVITALVCVFILIVWGFDRLMQDFTGGAAILASCGILLPLLAPLKFLYKTTTAKILSIVCLSWMYSFVLLSLSMALPRATGTAYNPYIILAIETLFYAVTFPTFYRMMRNKYLIMFRQLPEKQVVTLMWLGILWFVMVFGVNLGFAYPAVSVFRVLSMLAAPVCVWVSYRYIYQLIEKVRSAKALEHVVHIDPLTQLKNRIVFSYDAKGLLRRKVPFRLVFLDLNNFKAINDRYGHLTGDQYLIFFAHMLKERIGDGNELYRLSGDEFLCVYTGSNIQRFVDSVTSLPETLSLSSGDTPFLGVSYGVVSFPEDADSLDELLRMADKQMYIMKSRENIPDSVAGS